MKSLLKLAKKLRKEILVYEWEFKGDFETYKPSTIYLRFWSGSSLALIQQTHRTENRALKVLGGIKGIANSCQALSESFLSAAEMGSIVGNFCETFGIEENQSRKRDEHHQLFGSKNKRIYSNTEKILRVFQTHNVNFEASDSVFNILTKKVLPSRMLFECKRNT